MKRSTALFCKWAGYVWLVIATILILLGLIGNVIAGDFWNVWSPFNIGNYLMVALTFAPGIGLLAAHDYLLKHNP